MKREIDERKNIYLGEMQTKVQPYESPTNHILPYHLNLDVHKPRKTLSLVLFDAATVLIPLTDR